MRRDFDALASGPFDLLVVGGGIYGAWTAYDAALRGLSVALIDKQDWGAGTSSASSKLIHGGLRYLEQRNFGLVRRSLDERRRLWRLAPHRVRPLRFAVPLYRGDRVGRTKLRLGLWLYDRLARGDQPVPRHAAVSRAELHRDYPFLRTDGLKGGFTYGDCVTDDARFTLEIVDGALDSGVVAVNHARARELLVSGGRVVGAAVEDRETGREIEVQARITASCAGPWSPRLVEGAGGPALALRRAKGVHLVMPRLPTDDAFLLFTRHDRRVIFFIPWYGRTLLGTTDTDYTGDPDAARATPTDVAYLLAEANRVLDGIEWTEADIVASFAGVRTLRAGRSRATSALSREFAVERPMDGLFVPLGGKYTSAREDAARAVDAVMQAAGRPRQPAPTAERPFPWKPAERLRLWSAPRLNQGLTLGLDEATAAQCVLRYGARVERLFEEIRRAPGLAERVVPDLPFCLAEVLHAVTDEMARDLTDVLRRRVPLLLLARLSPERLSDLAVLVGRILDWPDERIGREIAAVTPPGRQRIDARR